MERARSLLIIKYIFIAFSTMLLMISCKISKSIPEGSETVFEEDIIYDNVLATSERMHKPVVIDFTATWCGPCKVMDKYVFSDITLTDRMKREFINIRIDVDNPKYKDLVVIYNASVLPTLVIVDDKGAELARRQGSLSISGVHRFLDEALNAFE